MSAAPIPEGLQGIECANPAARLRRELQPRGDRRAGEHVGRDGQAFTGWSDTEAPVAAAGAAIRGSPALGARAAGTRSAGRSYGPRADREAYRGADSVRPLRTCGLQAEPSW